VKESSVTNDVVLSVTNTHITVTTGILNILSHISFGRSICASG